MKNCINSTVQTYNDLKLLINKTLLRKRSFSDVMKNHPLRWDNCFHNINIAKEIYEQF